MIDVHFHCLPGVDDGPRDWDEAVALCRAAADEGTHTIVATPHVLREGWINDDPSVRDELLLKLNTRLGGSPAVLAGCEYFFSADALELWEKGSSGPLTGLNRSNYLLVEFPPSWVPANAELIFHEFSLLNVVPVIAHPERNLELATNPDRLAELIRKGAVAQLTAGSVVGTFGKSALAAAHEFLRRRLVHLIASDAHSLIRRPPQLRAARKSIETQYGREQATTLFETNPSAVINGGDIVGQ